MLMPSVLWAGSSSTSGWLRPGRRSRRQFPWALCGSWSSPQRFLRSSTYPGRCCFLLLRRATFLASIRSSASAAFLLPPIPGIYRSVEKRFDDALVLDPNLTLAWNSKGILLGTICRLDESIACFDEALRIDSTAAKVWNNKGVSLDWNGKHNESLRCYDRAIELKPELAVAWLNRAKTLSFNLSLFSLAQANASQAIKLDPSLENESLQMTWNYIQAI